MTSRRPAVFLAVGLFVVFVGVVLWRDLIATGVFVAALAWTWRRAYPRENGGGVRRWLDSLALLVGANSARKLANSQAGDLHDAKIATELARADELRSRVELRARRRDEQESAERAAYWKGARDAT